MTDELDTDVIEARWSRSPDSMAYQRALMGAYTDVSALLAEVRRLRAALAQKPVAGDLRRGLDRASGACPKYRHARRADTADANRFRVEGEE